MWEVNWIANGKKGTGEISEQMAPPAAHMIMVIDFYQRLEDVFLSFSSCLQFVISEVVFAPSFSPAPVFSPARSGKAPLRPPRRFPAHKYCSSSAVLPFRSLSSQLSLSLVLLSCSVRSYAARSFHFHLWSPLSRSASPQLKTMMV